MGQPWLSPLRDHSIGDRVRSHRCTALVANCGADCALLGWGPEAGRAIPLGIWLSWFDCSGACHQRLGGDRDS